MSRTAVVVQARVGSTRLPGKVLQVLRGKTVLAHALARCAAIPRIDAVVCATSDLPQDDPIAIHNIPFTGTDALLWGNDYPHEEGTYPNSRAIVDRLATGLDDDIAHRVFRDNAVKLFHFDEQVLAEPLPIAS